MKTGDLVKLALLNLSRRKSRTLLTVLGVIVGTACIVLMLSIGWSNYCQFAQMLEDSERLTRIELSDYSGGERGGITDSTIAQIAALDHVAAVSPLVEVPVTMQTGAYTATTSLIGIDPAVLSLQFEQGGIFPSGSASPVLAVGGAAVRNFTDPENPPDFSDWEACQRYSPSIDWENAQISVQFGYAVDEDESSELPLGMRYRATVSGVTRESDSQDDSRIFIDLAMAKRMLAENRELARVLGRPVNAYQEVLIRADSMDSVPGIMEEVQRLGYETYSETSYIQDMREEQVRQQGQLFAIGVISLLVSAIGIANTMYASVLERRRSIGVMKVLGMSRRRISALFLAEAAIIGIVGGFLGLGFSWIVVLAINTGTQATSFLGMYFSKGMRIEIPGWVAAGAVGTALVTGLVSGVYPARKATKMSPLEAMRGTS